MKKIYKLVNKSLYAHLTRLLLFVFLTFIAGLCALYLPALSSSFIDYLVEAIDNPGMSDIIIRFLVLFMTLSLVSLVTSFLASRLNTSLQYCVSFDINKRVIFHAQGLPSNKYKKIDSAELSQKIYTDSNVVTQYALSVISNTTMNVLKLFFPIIIIFDKSKVVLLILILLAILYILSYQGLRSKLFHATFKLKSQQSKYFSSLYEQLGNLFYIKKHGFRDIFINRLNPPFHELYEIAMGTQRVQYLISGTDTVILMLGQMTVFLFAGNSVIAGELTIGEFTLISTYFNMVIGAIRYFYSIGASTQAALVSCTRLDNILRDTIEKDGSIKMSGVRTIDVRQLSFKYENNVPVLKNISCCFREGHIHTVLGANGAGKSTLLQIIAGLHEGGYTGTVQYDEISISQIDMDWMRKEQIGFVSQIPDLPLSSIQENLVYGQEKSTNHIQDINYLAKKLGLDINSFGENKSAQGESVRKLSGGEREKIAIIRELLKHPRIIIMDEPTTALDKQSCEQLIDLLRSIKDETMIIIASHDQRIIAISDSIIEV